MEEYIANKTITKVYKGKTGEGQYGPWVAWNFNIEGDDRKFSYFSGGKKPEPFEGAFIAMMKYETVTKGKYTNHNVKEMALGNDTTINNEPRQDPDQGPPDDYEPPGEKDGYVDKPTTAKSSAVRKDVSYSFFPKQAVDTNVAWLTAGNFPEETSFDEFVDSIIRTTDKMYDAALKKINDVPF